MYTRSFDGTGYSTISPVEVNIASEEKTVNTYTQNILLSVVAIVAVLMIYGMLKRKR